MNLVVRAYSVVSSPFDETLEFFLIVVPEGGFTSNLQHLKVDDDIYLEKIPYGFLNSGALSVAVTKRLMVTWAQGQGWHPLFQCYKTLRRGRSTRALHWFIVYV